MINKKLKICPIYLMLLYGKMTSQHDIRKPDLSAKVKIMNEDCV
jgi:hypothetical protein